MKKIICLVLLLISISVFSACIEITEDIQLDDDNESCFIITESDILFDCNGYSICDDAGDTCITVDAEDATITDCDILGDSGKTAVRINEDGAKVEDTTIQNAKTAIYINSIEECVIKNLEIRESGTGIYIKSSKNIEIEDIEMYDTDTGLSISSSSDISLEDIFLENEDGMYYYIRFLVENEDGDPIKDAEITLETSKGIKPFNSYKTDEYGYSEWKQIMVVSYDGGDETDVLFNLTVEYEDEEYFEEDFEIRETKTFVIELDVEIEDDLAALGASCTKNSECASGYCCLQGDNRFTCRPGPTFCIAYECTKDAECKKDEVCENNKCIELTGECGYADDHEWIEYECCKNSDCQNAEKCEDHKCIKVVCECGDIKNHECEAECCSSKDCPSGYKCVDMFCLPGNVCTSDDECQNTQTCNNGFCEEVTDICGYAFNHRWISYECCSDTDCIDNKICQGNVCIINKEGTEGSVCASAFIILSTFIFGFYLKKE
ncbi:hypothetical protein KO317_01705 [Candidatus Micrarchaeota archaeon]|nr:hypothetical protein [Candidatus Micrarchaeota archaeon]